MTNAEIQVGKYVRTKEGYISKVKEVTDDYIECESAITVHYEDTFDTLYPDEFDTIINHSFNIIDLIEVGDYVNGVKIGQEELFDNGLRIISEAIGDCYYETTFRSDKPEEVKTIVTKEQFKAVEYKVGGEDD